MEIAGGASCDESSLSFRLRDPDRRLAGVRLSQKGGVPRDRVEFTYVDAEASWCLDVPRPAAWRLEYQLELRYPDGGTELVCDPDNPRRVGGAFGDKSVVECPGYTAPAWLDLPVADGRWRELAIAAPAVKAEVWARIWSPVTPTDRVLLAHDGPEYDKLASLGQYSAAMVGTGRVAPHHLVLLAPGRAQPQPGFGGGEHAPSSTGERDEWYSANPAYSWALVADVLPRLYAELGTVRPVVGMGASLGGLAMLHAQRRYPGAFAALYLQSGSFFLPRFDRQESGFRRYLRIVRFAGRVVRATGGPPPVPAVLTCGRVEENLHNNRAMAAALRRQGYPVQMFEVPDAHNYTGWRDAFDPYLTDLLRYVWG